MDPKIYDVEKRAVAARVEGVDNFALDGGKMTMTGFDDKSNNVDNGVDDEHGVRNNASLDQGGRSVRPRNNEYTTNINDNNTNGEPPLPSTRPAPAAPPSTATDDDDDYYFDPPDGGWRAWSQVLAAHLINAMTWGYAATFGVYQLHYVDTLGLPAAQVSWIGSVQVFLSFAVCAVSGRLADAGHARATVAAGCALAVLGTFLTSLATTYWHIFLAQGVCTGLGLGIAFMPAVSVASSYFRRNRPLALAVAAVGTSVGSLVFPATVHYLTPTLGFPWAVRCSAFVALVAFRELPYMLFALGSFLNFYVLYFGFFYINSYARNIIGFSSLDSVTLLLITNALGIPTRPLAGYLANNHLGPINVFTLSTVLLCGVVFGWMGVATRTTMYVYSVMFGVAVSANQGTFVAALASLTEDPRKMGIRFGMVETVCSFATLAGPPTAGAIIDRSGGEYRLAQVWGGVVLAAAALTFAASRVAATGWRWRVKI
ncbi:major facilitator superfamily protein [Hirsutella rhossiliensis]|uniref:Major facilitator superfamily domain-containing protein n=1 Tax=Hirsutella rhossiliensis TaxID=111463 RepID=A0A9P8N159_9HYPO|nr:major facilitator superfamily domain-containing protein [Hirsutella rhossiliensis]KAH0964990.1 major facilitator superfamily domain-containing protein [Hirsutella rhossiliensis]